MVSIIFDEHTYENLTENRSNDNLFSLLNTIPVKIVSRKSKLSLLLKNIFGKNNYKIVGLSNRLFECIGMNEYIIKLSSLLNLEIGHTSMNVIKEKIIYVDENIETSMKLFNFIDNKYFHDKLIVCHPDILELKIKEIIENGEN